MKREIIKSIILLAFFVCFLSSVNTDAHETENSMAKKPSISKEDAIEIAKQEAIKWGFDVKTMKIKTSLHSVPWNSSLPKVPLQGDKDSVLHKKKLEGKVYWMVFLAPKKLMVGGNLSVFVDAQSGQILTAFGGE